jgi:hypothetical protein
MDKSVFVEVEAPDERTARTEAGRIAKAASIDHSGVQVFVETMDGVVLAGYLNGGRG